MAQEDNNLKNGILRGVYEVNVRDLGKGAPRTVAPPPQRTVAARGARPGLAAFAALVSLVIALSPESYDEAALPIGDRVAHTTLSGGMTINTPFEPLVAEPVSREGFTMARLPGAEPIEPKPAGDLPTPEAQLDPMDLATPLVAAQVPLKNLFGLSFKTIVIDPGHGGRDPGATTESGTQEKDITLDIARRLRQKLESVGGYRVLMTRTWDKTISLNHRVRFANDESADLFVSIHVNYLPDTTLNVLETYYFGPHMDEKGLRLAEQENKGSGYHLSQFKEIIRKMGDTLKLQESKALAAAIQGSLYRNMTLRRRQVRDLGTKTAPFVVLLGVDAPSVLAEVSCLNNGEEEKALGQPEYRDDIASFLAEGIVRYMEESRDDGEMKNGRNRIAAAR